MKRVTDRPCSMPMPALLFDPPLLRPQGRLILMAGGPHALQPLRHDEGLGAEIERQVRQVLGVDGLQLVPHLLPLAAVKLDLDATHEVVEIELDRGKREQMWHK